MTDHPQASPERLDEIRRLASIAEAEDRAAQATMARKRKVFGPLTYGTLVIAAIVTVYTGRAAGWPVRRAGDDAIGGARPRQGGSRERRPASRVEMGDPRRRCQFDRQCSGPVWPRGRDVWFSRRGAPGVAQGARRRRCAGSCGAADVLGKSPPFAKLAKQELLVALTDTDPTVRLAAAAALLQIKDDSTVAALQTLSELLTDPIPSSERMSVFSVMTSEGSAGRDAAVKSVASMLSSHDVLLRKAAIDCVSALGPDAPRARTGPRAVP